jgi:hypothetical protein
MSEIYCSVKTPTGNTIILIREDEEWKTLVASPDSEIVVSDEDAERWHRMAASLRKAGACVCRPLRRAA